MKTKITALALRGLLALSACTTLYSDDEVAGALVGAGLGTITAKVLGADPAWTVVGALTGAAAGSLVARNRAANQCAYARGDGTYYTAPCP